jgi:REP element-mobilizing transposase RayT
MAPLQALYTRANCTFCAPLRWGLTLFWRHDLNDATWLPELAAALEPDGIRVLGHRFPESDMSQFALSTLPLVTPLRLVSRVKGRLQYLVRKDCPKAFQRNYALRSFGAAMRQAVEGYIASQLRHHSPADQRAAVMLEDVQIVNPGVDLAKPRSTSHGIYWYNLHVVLVHQQRWADIDAVTLDRIKKMVEGVCRAKGFALSRAGILADHVHLAIGCLIDATPADIALAFLNNLAYVHGMKAVFQFGAFVGTIGEYHLGAVRSDQWAWAEMGERDEQR